MTRTLTYVLVRCVAGERTARLVCHRTFSQSKVCQCPLGQSILPRLHVAPAPPKTRARHGTLRIMHPNARRTACPARPRPGPVSRASSSDPSRPCKSLGYRRVHVDLHRHLRLVLAAHACQGRLGGSRSPCDRPCLRCRPILHPGKRSAGDLTPGSRTNPTTIAVILCSPASASTGGGLPQPATASRAASRASLHSICKTVRSR